MNENDTSENDTQDDATQPVRPEAIPAPEPAPVATPRRGFR
jgi:hypothetical protein